jgi:hypothetical protein
LLVAVLTCIAAGIAALEVYAIVDGFGSQPNNCYVEDSTKVSVLGVFGSIVVVIALATVAMGGWAVVTGRPSVGKVAGAFAATLASLVVWVHFSILAFGC